MPNTWVEVIEGWVARKEKITWWNQSGGGAGAGAGTVCDHLTFISSYQMAGTLLSALFISPGFIPAEVRAGTHVLDVSRRLGLVLGIEPDFSTQHKALRLVVFFLG